MRISRWAIGSAALLLSGGAYWYYTASKSPTSSSGTQVAIVSRGTISTTVKTTGKIAPVQTSILNFVRQGTVKKIYKQVGDAVKAGDVIAEVDASDAYMDIESAKISLNNANNTYAKLFQNTTEGDIIKAKNSLEESRNSLRLLEAEYEDFLTNQKHDLIENEEQLSLLEDKVNLARNDLEYTKKNLDATNDVSNLERDIANSYLSVEEIARFFPTTFTSIKNLIYIDNKSSERYGDLGSKNSYQKTQMEKLALSISGSLANFDKNLSVLRAKDARSLDEVLSLLTTSRTILQDMNSLSADAVITYDNTPTGIPFSDIEIDDAQDELRTLGSNISSKLTSLNTTYTTLKNYGTDEIQSLSNKNAISSKEQSLKSAQNELEKAKRNLEELKSSQNTDKISKQNDIVRARNSVTSNEITYNEMVNGPTSTDLKSAKNSISNANISLSKAYLALKDYQIVAPFDGIVNDIPWRIGDVTTSSEGVLLENKNAYEISLLLDQIDIVKVNAGMSAKITLDAFPNETYTGKVNRVSAVPTETSGVVSYEAVVELSIPRTDIYSKMSATVEVIVTETSNVPTLPASAITTENGKSYVNKITDLDVLRAAMAKNMPSGSGGIRPGAMGGSGRSSSGRTISGERPFSLSGSSQSTSGSQRSGSGNTRSRTNIRSDIIQISTSIPSEKIEITIGTTNGDKTEILDGLSLGDAVIISSTTKASTTTTSSRSSTSNTRTQGGFGAGGPPF